MNFRHLTKAMKAAILQQKDPKGDISRSGFVSTISKLILIQFVENENEERELRLQKSTQVQNESNELKPIREGLTKLFNSLDINHSQLVPTNQIISILCLLSEEPIDVRLKVCIEHSIHYRIWSRRLVLL